MFQLLTLDAPFATIETPTTPGRYSRIFRRNGVWKGQVCHQQELVHVHYRYNDDVLGYWVGNHWVAMAEDTSEWIE